MVSSVCFHDLCLLFEKISYEPRKSRARFLYEFMNKQRALVQSSEDAQVRAMGLYPVARLLLPACDRDRGNYGIKESKLAQRYIRVLGLAKGGTDAQRLVNFRAPAANADLAGDFAAVVCHVIKDLVQTHPSRLTLTDVNKQLDQLAQSYANNNSVGEDQVLQNLLQNTSVLEQKWLIRIILKNVKFGLGRTCIFRSIHPDAEKLFDVCSSLKEVCEKLLDITRRMNEVEITLCTPFAPMLADRVDIGQLQRHVTAHPRLLCETKLDGERVQIHRLNATFKYFSRRGIDYSDKFGATAEAREGSLTPRLVPQLIAGAKSFILDGEMMAWDRINEVFKHKGQNLDVKYLKADGDTIPCFCVFDVLYYNGEVLTNRPLTYRVETLKKLFVEKSGVIVHTKRWEVTSKEEIQQSLNDAIDAQDEGIMMKDPNSVYKPSERKGGWWKVKPEYNDTLMEHLDLVILGGYWGGGARSGIVSQFLLGVMGTPSANGKAIFQTVGKVGSGYTRAELSMVMERLKNSWQNTQPSNIQCTGSEKPDVWVEPTKSVMLEVKASEIVLSGVYFTRCTLRFPRTEKPRYDLSWKDCLTAVRLEEIRKLAAGKLAMKRVTDSTIASKRKRPTTSRVVELTLASQFQPTDVSGVTKESNVLHGKEFCVMTKGAEKGDLEKLITQHGGTFVQNPGRNTWAVIATSPDHLRVQNLVQVGKKGRPKYDVVRASWLQELVTKGRMRSLEPLDLFFASVATHKKLRQSHDCFGDSYNQPVTRETLQLLLDNWPKVAILPKANETDIQELEDLLLEGTNFKNIFRPYTAYFDQYKSIERQDAENYSFWTLELAKKDFLFYGGTVASSFDPDQINLVVTNRAICNSSRIEEFRRHQHVKCRFEIVTFDWIQGSLDACHPLPAKDFHP